MSNIKLPKGVCESMDIVDIEEKLKQQIRKDAKAVVIFGVVLCTALLIAIIVSIVSRVKAVKIGNTETTSWLNFGIVVMIIAFVAIFIKYIILVYLDIKGEKYEKIRLVVISVRKWLNIRRGYWEYNALVENIATKEQFTIEDGKDLEEDKTYYMLRAQHSKLFAYAPFEFDIPKE